MSITNEDVVQALGNLTVMELLALTKELEQKWGVEAKPQLSMAPTALPVETVKQEQTEFSLTLVSFPADKKITLIKLVRDVLGLGLTESKTMVETLPKMIKEGMGKEETEMLKAKFAEVGGVVEVK